MMKVRQWITGVVLLLLVAAAVVAFIETRESPADDGTATSGKKAQGRKGVAAGKKSLVDLRPLQTARRMAALAGTPEEQRLAHEAERVGDQEVDLAFFDSLRMAEENPPTLSPDAKQI